MDSPVERWVLLIMIMKLKPHVRDKKDLPCKCVYYGGIIWWHNFGNNRLIIYENNRMATGIILE